MEGGAFAFSADANQAESFSGLLLRSRGRTGLTQRELGERVGVHRRSIQDWESGLNHPTAERLKALIQVLMEAGGFSSARQADEAEAMWACVKRDAPRMHASFDEAWFAPLLSEHATPSVALEQIQAGGERFQDWGEAPDVSGFVNRTSELAQLRCWMLDESCRLIAVLGMSGIGKTVLTAQLAQEVEPAFQRVYWRSLRDAPPVSEWLAGAIGFLSDQQLMSPPSESEGRTVLLRLLRERRCLLVLDDFEALLKAGDSDGRYREGLAGYRCLLEVLGEAGHQSTVLLTSREAPVDLVVMSGGAVRTLQLGGLGADAVRLMLAPKRLVGTAQHWNELTARLGGNGLALRIACETIRELFDGDIGTFLEVGAISLHGGIQRLFTEQFDRTSALERQVLRVLAVERGPVHLAALIATLGPINGSGPVLEAVDALRRRSLVERAGAPGAVAFTLQSVVLEYVTDRLLADGPTR